jgi:hypothetical protein
MFGKNTLFMKKVLSVFCPLLLFVLVGRTQDEKTVDETFKMYVGGSFAKPKMFGKMEKIALAQTSIYFKTVTTREVIEQERGAFGRRKTDGGSVAGRLTAYLQTTDGELTDADFQELADGFYKYLSTKLQENGVGAVDWNAISNAEFYKEQGMDVDDIKKDMDAMKKKGQIYAHINSNKGNSLWRYDINGGISPGFAFGKAKKAAKFSEEVGGDLAFMHIIVDFADIILDGDVKTGEKTNYGAGGITTITKTKSWKMDASVGANIKVVSGGMSMFYNEKNQTESMGVTKEISSGIAFATSVEEDPTKQKLRNKDNIFARDFNMTPVVISTTKAQYKAAAKKALENYADMFVLKIKYSKKA